MKNKSILVFGGSFSPPTNAHFSLLEQTLNEYPQIEKAIILPVGDLYVKKGLLSAKHRFNMLKAVCDVNDKFDVSDIEINSKKLLNTIDSLNIIKKQYKDHDIVFIMGSDNLREFHAWEGFKKLVNDFKFLIVERNGTNAYEIIRNSKYLSKHEDNFYISKEVIRNDNSSTYVRSLLIEGKSIRYLVPDEVYNYIKEHDLF